MMTDGPMRALGAMSGTSLDGVDAAEVITDGAEIHGFGATGYRAFDTAERETLRAALGTWPGAAAADAAAEVVETAHAELLARFPDAEVVGFHGQTLAHDPGGAGTHQAGSGDILAEVLGRTVVWDFRSSDVALGGQGAPLAPFFHFACARWIGAGAPVAFLNLGGVGNLSWVDPRRDRPEEAGALMAFDTGPANAPIDDLLRARRGVTRDAGGALAAAGRADESVVARFLEGAYFHRMPPKSLDRGDFAALDGMVAHLGDADAAATLCAVAAACVARGAEHFPQAPARLLVGGGGRHNATMMAMLAERLSCDVAPVEAAGLDGDMLEAQAFAHLAVRVMRGMPTSCPATTGVSAAVAGGMVSRPGGTSVPERPGRYRAAARRRRA